MVGTIIIPISQRSIEAQMMNYPRRPTQFMTEQGCQPRPSGSLASLLTSYCVTPRKQWLWSQHSSKCVCCVPFTHFITSLSSMRLFCDIRIKGSNKCKTMETVSDFIFLGSKVTADGDCSHEIKRRLLLGRKVMTNLEYLKAETLLCQQSSI